MLDMTLGLHGNRNNEQNSRTECDITSITIHYNYIKDAQHGY